MFVSEASGFTAKAASAACLTGRGTLTGIFVSAASATPTIKVYDGTDNTGAVIVDVFAPIAGTFYPIPAQFQTGLYVEIAGTVKYTAFVSRQ